MTLRKGYGTCFQGCPDGRDRFPDVLTRIVIGIAVAICFLVFLWGWVRLQETWGIFHPTPYTKAQVQNLPEGLEAVDFQAEDGVRLTGVLRRPDPGRPVVLMAHGNAGNVLGRLDWFEVTLPDGWGGLVFDYRGYGRSEGQPSEDGIYRDARAAREYLLETTEADKIVYHGRSLGVPVVAHLARETAPEAILLESGFPDATSMAKQILPLPGIRWLLSVRFEAARWLREAREQHGQFPVLVIHGQQDAVVPQRLGKRLAEQIGENVQTYWVPRAGHNDLVSVAGSDYTNRINEFLTDSVASTGTGKEE